MGTPIKPPTFSKETKQSYSISSVHSFSNSKSFQAVSHNFSSLKPTRSFIQATKSTPIFNSQYFEKLKTLEVTLLEPEFNFDEIPKNISYIFTSDFIFIQNNATKSQQFYEFILVDTELKF